MSKKAATVLYVAPIPKERSGIGRDVPAHVKLGWWDSQGRHCSMELPLPEEAVAAVASLPDLPDEDM